MKTYSKLFFGCIGFVLLAGASANSLKDGAIPISLSVVAILLAIGAIIKYKEGEPNRYFQ